MSALQIVIIAVLFCLNALDGFDVLAISFAAPGITRDWAASPQAIGLMISVGLFAAGFGSLGVAPLADRIGRRPMILASLVTMTVGAVICATATGTTGISVGRLFTGTGVGALVPCISALTAEYSSQRYKDRCVIIMAVGFPVGGLIGDAPAAQRVRQRHHREARVKARHPVDSRRVSAQVGEKEPSVMTDEAAERPPEREGETAGPPPDRCDREVREDLGDNRAGVLAA